jgi:hypothetical protein
MLGTAHHVVWTVDNLHQLHQAEDVTTDSRAWNPVGLMRNFKISCNITVCDLSAKKTVQSGFVILMVV